MEWKLDSAGLIRAFGSYVFDKLQSLFMDRNKPPVESNTHATNSLRMLLTFWILGHFLKWLNVVTWVRLLEYMAMPQFPSHLPTSPGPRRPHRSCSLKQRDDLDICPIRGNNILTHASFCSRLASGARTTKFLLDQLVPRISLSVHVLCSALIWLLVC